MTTTATSGSSRLAGRRALVTGGAQGLGLAFARALVKEGSDVMVLDIDPRVEHVVAALDEFGARVFALCVDVSDPDDVVRGVAHAATVLGGLDIVVNNAAIVRVTKPVAVSYTHLTLPTILRV